MSRSPPHFTPTCARFAAARSMPRIAASCARRLRAAACRCCRRATASARDLRRRPRAPGHIIEAPWVSTPATVTGRWRARCLNNVSCWIAPAATAPGCLLSRGERLPPRQRFAGMAAWILCRGAHECGRLFCVGGQRPHCCPLRPPGSCSCLSCKSLLILAPAGCGPGRRLLACQSSLRLVRNLCAGSARTLSTLSTPRCSRPSTRRPAPPAQRLSVSVSPAPAPASRTSTCRAALSA
jgi:hypothetical protein